MLNIVLVVQVNRLDKKVDVLEEKLTAQHRDTRDFLYNWEDCVYESAQKALKDATKQVVDFTFEPVGIDKEHRSLLADLSVTLREWSENTQVTMLVTLNGSMTEISMVNKATGEYTGELSLPVSENGGVVELNTGVIEPVLTWN